MEIDCNEKKILWKCIACVENEIVEGNHAKGGKWKEGGEENTPSHAQSNLNVMEKFKFLEFQKIFFIIYFHT